MKAGEAADSHTWKSELGSKGDSNREQFEIHLALERMQNNKNYCLLVFPQKYIKTKGLNRVFSFSYMESPHLYVIPHFPDKTE